MTIAPVQEAAEIVKEEGGDILRGQIQTHRTAQKFRRFVDVEAQILNAEFDQLVPGTVAR